MMLSPPHRSSPLRGERVRVRGRTRGTLLLLWGGLSLTLQAGLLPVVWAQPSNGKVTLPQDTLASSGGEIGGTAGLVGMVGSLGGPAGGQGINEITTLTGGFPTEAAAAVVVPSTQPTNGIVTLLQETLTPLGTALVSGAPVMIVTVGQPGGGLSAGGEGTVIGGYPTEPPPWPGGTRLMTVAGSVDASTRSVRVNGVAATLSSGVFSAQVPIFEGANAVTAVASDEAGNTAGASITVHLVSQPPPKPTVWPTPAVTPAATFPLSGTKTPGTSIWVNGVERVPLNDATHWVTTVNLTEGDNVFLLTAKNALGNTSSSAAANIIVDNLPPVIAVSPGTPTKTNVNPFRFTGTVDDSLTDVAVNSLAASRAGRHFEAPVPLLEGPNLLTIVATSPRGYVSSMTRAVTLGTIPVITGLQPSDGAKRAAGTTLTIHVAAADKEHDPVEFQILDNGAMLVDWSPSATHPWTPAEAERGVHTLEARARDGYGGEASQQAQVYVTRAQVQPVSP